MRQISHRPQIKEDKAFVATVEQFDRTMSFQLIWMQVVVHFFKSLATEKISFVAIFIQMTPDRDKMMSSTNAFVVDEHRN